MADNRAELGARSISRRQALIGAGAAGLLLHQGISLPKALAWPTAGPAAEPGAGMGGAQPRPIPTSFFSYGNSAGFHIYPPGRAYPLYGSKYFEPSTIYDFKGQVATIDVMATGVETATADGSTMTVDTRALYRTMDGTYVGVDGNEHEGVFSFI
jgi:hypothetical protein